MRGNEFQEGVSDHNRLFLYYAEKPRLPFFNQNPYIYGKF